MKRRGSLGAILDAVYHRTHEFVFLIVNLSSYLWFVKTKCKCKTFLIRVREYILWVEYSSAEKILKLLIELRFVNEELYTYYANQKERVLVTISLQNAF